MKYECDNCNHQGTEENLPDVKKLFSRLTVGGIFTDKECPKCGALCFPITFPKVAPAPEDKILSSLEHAIQFLDNEHNTQEKEGQDIKTKLESVRATHIQEEKDKALIYEGDNDYLFNESHNSVWISVNDFSVYILNYDDGVAIEIYDRFKELEIALDSAYAGNEPKSDFEIPKKQATSRAHRKLEDKERNH